MHIGKVVLLSAVVVLSSLLGLGQGQSFQLWELSFNPVGPEYLDGRLNPFHIPAIREAMNWVIDRQYIVENLCPRDGRVPWFFPVSPSYLESLGLADLSRALQTKYAYDFRRARDAVGAEMEKLGATLTGGKWYYKGKLVVVKVLMRSEDERRAIGEYFATQLEQLGFSVTRIIRRSADAAAIWTGDPAVGEWDVYTGAWRGMNVVNEDKRFEAYYAAGGDRFPQKAFKPDPELDAVIRQLGRGDYATTEERRDLVARALDLCMKDSVRIWLAFKQL